MKKRDVEFLKIHRAAIASASSFEEFQKVQVAFVDYIISKEEALDTAEDAYIRTAFPTKSVVETEKVEDPKSQGDKS